MIRISNFLSRKIRKNSVKNFSNYQEIVNLRHKYQSPSLNTFEAYDKPLVLEKGKMQYMWDSEDNKYIDLLGQNLCISVGHCHPTVINGSYKTNGKIITLY